MTGRWRQDWGRTSDDPFLSAIQGRMVRIRAPESLRARIGAMLAVERAHLPAGEPEPPRPR